jgi:hypothetical protein
MKFLKVLIIVGILFHFNSCYENPSLNTKSNLKGMLPNFGYRNKEIGENYQPEIGVIRRNTEEGLDAHIQSQIGNVFQRIINDDQKWSGFLNQLPEDQKETAKDMRVLVYSINQIINGIYLSKPYCITEPMLTSLIYCMNKLYGYYNSLTKNNYDPTLIIMLFYNAFVRIRSKITKESLLEAKKALEAKNDLNLGELLKSIDMIIHNFEGLLSYFSVHLQAEMRNIFEIIKEEGLIKKIESSQIPNSFIVENDLNIIVRMGELYQKIALQPQALPSSSQNQLR